MFISPRQNRVFLYGGASLIWFIFLELADQYLLNSGAIIDMNWPIYN